MTAAKDDVPIAARFTDVQKTFFTRNAPVEAVRNVSLDLPKGSFTSIVGPSGCGKSTLLHMLAGLDRPTRGSIEYMGRPVTGVNTSVGYVTQHDDLLPWRTAEKNVALGLEFKGRRPERRAERVRELMKIIGLEGFEKTYPRELSGGMRKRVGLARAFAADPETLLMDEPFGALDAQMRAVMQQELLRLWEASGKTVLFVTHDLQEAIALSDVIVVMTRRPSVVKTVRTVDLPRPRSLSSTRANSAAIELQAELWESLSQEFAGVDQKTGESE